MFSTECNPHLKFCTCFLCQDIIRRPILLVPCEHVFCMTCLIPKVEGTLKSDSKCPQCSTLIEDITSSKNTVELTKSLKLSCPQDCGITFFATETGLKEKNEHQCPCPVGNKSSESLNRNNDISREMEEVAMCVIKHKLANSTRPNKTIEFKTGGSRVSTLSLGELRVPGLLLFSLVKKKKDY